MPVASLALKYTSHVRFPYDCISYIVRNYFDNRYAWNEILARWSANPGAYLEWQTVEIIEYVGATMIVGC